MCRNSAELPGQHPLAPAKQECNPCTAAPTPSPGFGRPDLEPNPKQQEKLPAGAGTRQGTGKASLSVTEQEQMPSFSLLATINADIPTNNWHPAVCPRSFGHQAQLGCPQPLGKN